MRVVTIMDAQGRTGHSQLIVLLAFNEEACIAETVGEVRSILPEADVLVVDDGSSDATAEQANLAGAMVLRHPINLGVSAAEASGLLFASRNRYRSVVRMDGDGQHAPASARALFDELGTGTQLALGTRFSEVVTFRSTWLRRFGNRVLARLVSSLCGFPVTDPTSGFRGFGGEAIRYFARVHPHDYPEPESILMAARRGFVVREVPVRMRPRRTGTSSLTPFKSAYYMLKVSFALLIERVRSTSP